jgi:hypothetical protein
VKLKTTIKLLEGQKSDMMGLMYGKDKTKVIETIKPIK